VVIARMADRVINPSDGRIFSVELNSGRLPASELHWWRPRAANWYASSASCAARC